MPRAVPNNNLAKCLSNMKKSFPFLQTELNSPPPKTLTFNVDYSCRITTCLTIIIMSCVTIMRWEHIYWNFPTVMKYITNLFFINGTKAPKFYHYVFLSMQEISEQEPFTTSKLAMSAEYIFNNFLNSLRRTRK